MLQIWHKLVIITTKISEYIGGLTIEGVIIKGIGGQYTIDTISGQYICNARGIFRKQKITPIIGDRVHIAPGANQTGTLTNIMPRINKLQRPKVSNVDQVLIVLAAAKPALHFAMLDRYLMQMEYEKIEGAICINKIDLDRDISRKVSDVYEPAGYPVFPVSVNDNVGFETLKKFLQSKTTVLAGLSGVGKSSIINKLTSGAASLATGVISERIGRGKHTTRHTEFIPLGSLGYIIDTPGFSSIDYPDIPMIKRAALFKEFRPLLGQCKFRDCLHLSEQDCAVKEQVGISINPERYARYLEWICNKCHN